MRGGTWYQGVKLYVLDLLGARGPDLLDGGLTLGGIRQVGQDDARLGILEVALDDGEADFRGAAE